MLTRRIVPCLDVKGGRVVKGVRFQRLRDAGDPVELGTLYAREGADEIVFLDIAATPDDRRTAAELAESVARSLFLPFTVGGGLHTVQEMRRVLHAGADKVAINTAAVAEPSLLERAAARFGSQAVVVAIDAYRAADGWRVRVRSGTREADIDAVEWAGRAAALGAGELLLTSIDRDGTRRGYDLELLTAVRAVVDVPIIASGGAGSIDHFAEALEAGADAALAASLFHFGEIRIPELKRELLRRGLPIRPPGRGVEMTSKAPNTSEGETTSDASNGGAAASEASKETTALDVRFDPDTGLVPAIVQSAEDGGVRMLAHMDAEALERTLRTGRATFFSRSRGRLWEKGETSGNRLDVVEIRADCDGDALLVRAVPRGPTCHTGRERCFDAGGAARPSGAAEAAGRALDAGPEETPGPAAGGPSAGASPRGGERLAELLVELEALIARGDRDRPADSYTTRLLEGGPAAVAQKVGEEAIETSLAAVAEPGRLAEESADLLYHLFVLWRTVGLEAADVAAVLRGRRERS